MTMLHDTAAALRLSDERRRAALLELDTLKASEDDTLAVSLVCARQSILQATEEAAGRAHDVVASASTEARALLTGARELLAETEKTADVAFRTAEARMAERSKVYADDLAAGVVGRLDAKAQALLETVGSTGAAAVGSMKKVAEKTVTEWRLAMDRCRASMDEARVEIRDAVDQSIGVQRKFIRRQEILKCALPVAAAMTLTAAVGAWAAHTYDGGRLDTEATVRWSVALTREDAQDWAQLVRLNPSIAAAITRDCRAGSANLVRLSGGHTYCRLALALDEGASLADGAGDWLGRQSPWLLLAIGACFAPLLRVLAGTALFRFLAGQSARRT